MKTKDSSLDRGEGYLHSTFPHVTSGQPPFQHVDNSTKSLMGLFRCFASEAK